MPSGDRYMRQPGCQRELKARAPQKAALAIRLPQIDESPLKRQCHEIFECCLFSSKICSGPIRGTMGRFCFLPKIHRDIWQNVGSAIYDTRRKGDSAVYLTQRILYKKVVLYFVLFESFSKWFKIWEIFYCDSVVYLTPRNGDSAVYLTP